MRIVWAAAAMIAVSMAACSGGDSEAFTAAKTAVAAQRGNAPSLVFDDLRLHQVVGLKGSKADVVCGDVAPDDNTVATHFIYIWKLQAAAPDPGRRAGETMIFDSMDRRATHALTFFCTPHPDLTGANAFDYFN